jgi:hypothetical protein
MKMTSFNLKVLACISMVSDHIGASLLNGNPWFRAPGRLAFPIFAYLIAFGFKHTKDTEMYLCRMIFFGFISQYIYNIAQSNYLFQDLNILLSFSLAIASLKLYEKNQNILIIIVAMLAAEFSHLDFGFNSILAVFLYYKASSNRQIVLYTVIVAIASILFKVKMVILSHPGIFDIASYLQVDPFIYVYLMAIFASPFIIAYRNSNFSQGIKAKYLFYVFYPAHLLVIAFFVKNPQYVQPIINMLK